jgi:hypothetical protein
MLDTESLLMVSIFQKAYPLRHQPPAAIFLHHFGFEINRTCRVLKLLGLAEEASSTLGFKLTHRLIDLITDGRLQPITEIEFEDVQSGFVDTLWQLVAGNNEEDEDDEDEGEQEDEDQIYGDERVDGRTLCCRVFVLLGLLQEKSDIYVPTRLMHKLILEDWVQKVSKTA